MAGTKLINDACMLKVNSDRHFLFIQRSGPSRVAGPTCERTQVSNLASDKAALGGEAVDTLDVALLANQVALRAP